MLNSNLVRLFAASLLCGSLVKADEVITQYDVLGKHIKRVHFNEIVSTQLYSRKDVALDALNKDDWVLVTADMQTGGIGSHSRKWISHIPGNVYATLNFPMEVKDPNGFAMMRNVFSLAVLEVMKDYLPNAHVAYKWPNDALVNGKKIAGVLCEYQTLENNIYHGIVGIGINVNLSKEILAEIDQPATSMVLEGGKDISKEDVLKAVIEKAITLMDNMPSVESGLKECFAFAGEEVIVHDDTKNLDICGILEGIGENGALLVNVGGEVYSVLNGTVIKK